MQVLCPDAGPVGLFFAIAAKVCRREDDITVCERPGPSDSPMRDELSSGCE